MFCYLLIFLYDDCLCCDFSLALGAGAVEFVICHAEVQIVFAEEKKIGEVLYFLVLVGTFLFPAFCITIQYFASDFKLPV